MYAVLCWSARRGSVIHRTSAFCYRDCSVEEMEDEVYHERSIHVLSKDLLERMRITGLLPRSGSFSDTDLDPEDVAAENEDSAYTDEKAHWERNHANLHTKLLRDNKWNAQQLLDAEHTFLKAPTASRIPSIVMHPGFNRSENMRSVGSTDELARWLLPEDLQSSWRYQVAAVKADRRIKQVFRNFTEGSDASDREVQDSPIDVVQTLSQELYVQCISKGELTFAVGGLLAKNRLVLHGRTDMVFADNNGNLILVVTGMTARPTGAAHLSPEAF
jgi:hypothetical protein